MLEVFLENPEDFLVVKETLTRMGTPLDTPNSLMQCCHILHKRGRYYVAHVNELRALDGENTEMTDDDYAVRDSIALLLEKWGLCDMGDYEPGRTVFVTVAPHREKSKWRIVSDYDIGKVKGKVRQESRGR